MWARKSLRDMILAIKERVGKLEGSMKDVKEALNWVEDRIDNWKVQSKDYVKMSLDSTLDKVKKLFNSYRDKLLERNYALEAMIMALKEETIATKMALSTRIDELEGELAWCRVAVGKGVSSVALSNEDVPKLKELLGTRSACDVDNFLWRMENYFRAKGITNDAVKIYLEFAEEEAQVKLQEITQWGTMGESHDGSEIHGQAWSKKDKLGSSKSEERGLCKKDHKEYVFDGNGNGDNGSKGKPRVGKKKPNRKGDKLKCFLCNGPHMLKKCPKKSAFKEKMQVIVKGKATSELGESSEGLLPKEEVNLSSNLREKVTMKTMKLGPMRLNSSEASELVKSSTRLPPMGELGGASDFKKKK
ncbi:hypothetical protein PVK06_008391 [Gossypium arboreum]|uniref:Uncharacterized protein n=1 Tax=Gossypium arboreum TaxID=29729 RepID=A0ABR0QKL0_GOSAR|nr:hypothetical protein PVK06_008391 [Gossypium arboreum]